MASSTKNVKLGVCQVFFDGVDLGYTQGGVEVTVTTETHKVNIDQFGNTTINEYIMGREVMAKVPMAETTLENLVSIMPGATLTTVGGTVATGSITVTTQPTAGETIIVNGTTVTFRTALTGVGVESIIGAAATSTAANLASALNASTDPKIATASYSAAGAIVTVNYGNQLAYGLAGQKGTEGNAFTLATGTALTKVTMSGAALTGGADPTGASVSVPTGVGNDLLSFARELRIHPVGKPLTDKSEDFVIPLAATPGAMNFAYKLDTERVYNTDFTGYPDGNGKLFTVGG
jgi:hypothetical protein